MTPKQQAAQWATMPPATWLAGADRGRRHDIVIAWDSDPDDLQPLPCGIRWDVVRVAEELGQPALGRLLASDVRDAIGPVLRDAHTGMLHWLIQQEEMPARWSGLPVRLLTHGDFLPAPSPESVAAPPVGWVHWPEITGMLTSPQQLVAAVERELLGDAR